MQLILSLVLACSQFVLALSSQPATTQPSRGGRAQPAARASYEPVVLRLVNANCHEISKMLSATFSGCASYPVDQSNSVVFSGPPDTVAMARKLVAEMDASVSEAGAPRVVVVDVKHRRVDDFVDQFMHVTDNRRLRVAADRARSKLLLRGDAEEIKQAERLLEQLDTPAAAVAIEFAFIQASSESQGPAIPADLAEVAKELERFGKLTLLGRLTTVAVEGDKFGVDGQIVPGIRAEVRGLVRSGSAEGGVKMEVQASLQMNSPNKAAGGSVLQPYFKVETSVATKRGEYLVLGTAPTGSKLGESVVLLMYVKE